MTIEKKAREIAESVSGNWEVEHKGLEFAIAKHAARLGIIEGLEMGAVRLDGWREWDWPEGVSRHAVAHVAEHFAKVLRALIEEQKV